VDDTKKARPKMDGPETPVYLRVFSRSPLQARDATTREAVVMRDMVAGDHLHAMKVEVWPQSVNRNPRKCEAGLQFAPENG
jgi:hypothetical protein